jgi:molybdopterin synthase sulfur carrier subunit
MEVNLKFHGVFRTAAEASEIHWKVSGEKPTIRSLVSELVSEERFGSLKSLLVDSETADPRPNALIIVSGREISALNGLETELKDNDEVAFLPIAHGG